LEPDQALAETHRLFEQHGIAGQRQTRARYFELLGEALDVSRRGEECVAVGEEFFRVDILAKRFGKFSSKPAAMLGFRASASRQSGTMSLPPRPEKWCKSGGRCVTVTAGPEPRMSVRRLVMKSCRALSVRQSVGRRKSPRRLSGRQYCRSSVR